MSQYGAGCHLSAKSHCAKYAGENADGCVTNPKGRCVKTSSTPKAKATPAQLSALAKGRAMRAQNKTLTAFGNIDIASRRQRGGGCHVGVSTRCSKYDGADADGCMTGPRGRCTMSKTLASRYAPTRQATPAQLMALAKARAVRSGEIKPKRKPTPAQLAAPAKARATRAQNTAIRQLGNIDISRRQSGGGCHIGASTRCSKYAGENADGCVTSAKGRCVKTKASPKGTATPAQRAALAKGRAMKTTNVAFRQLGKIDISRRQRGGGCGMPSTQQGGGSKLDNLRRRLRAQ